MFCDYCRQDGCGSNCPEFFFELARRTQDEERVQRLAEEEFEEEAARSAQMFQQSPPELVRNVSLLDTVMSAGGQLLKGACIGFTATAAVIATVATSVAFFRN